MDASRDGFLAKADKEAFVKKAEGNGNTLSWHFISFVLLQCLCGRCSTQNIYCWLQAVTMPAILEVSSSLRFKGTPGRTDKLRISVARNRNCR